MTNPRARALMVIALATASVPVSAMPIRPMASSPPRLTDGAPLTPTPVVDRPEIRSYQPYSGLQYGFRPLPSVQRGVRSRQPRVVMPRPVTPLLEYGNGGVSLGYSYCADRPDGTTEPPAGPYDAKPLPRAACP